MTNIQKSADNESVKDKENLLQALKVEAEKNEGQAKDGKSQDEIFDKIIESVEEVKFANLTGNAEIMNGSKKLEQKHYIVIVTEIILDKAQTLGYKIAMNNGVVYVFNGRYWVSIPEAKLQILLGKCAFKMGVDMIESKFFRFRENLLNQFFSCAYFTSPESSPDKVLINLQNGTFEVTTEKQSLRAFQDKDFLRYQLPFSYDTKATAPLFQTYLDKVLPEKDLQDILAEYIGYVFVKNLKLEKVLLLYGSGANGKSVFFEIVNAMLGRENISNFSLTSLNNETYRSNLEDKLLNYGSEIKGSLESDIFKQLASGEPIGAKRLYKDPFTMRDYAKLMFNANELPKDVEHNEAYFRRFLIVPFLVTIPTEERDPDLPKKIIGSELSGVFNWVLSGLSRVLSKKGFTNSKTSSSFLEKYKNESDTVFLFLEEQNYKPCYDGRGTGLKEIYTEYKLFCGTFGYYANNIKDFRKRLESNKLKIERKAEGNIVSTVKPPIF
jgi:putative DNA primase/helicase